MYISGASHFCGSDAATCREHLRSNFAASKITGFAAVVPEALREKSPLLGNHVVPEGAHRSLLRSIYFLSVVADYVFE